jgi:uncharacterized protein YtpQ (UPF0354 family)
MLARLVRRLLGIREPLLTEDAFAEQVLRALRRRGRGVVVTGSLADGFTVKLGPKTITIFVANTYLRYRADPANKKTYIDDFVESVHENLTREAAHQVERVIPVIKDRTYIDEILKAFANSKGPDGSPKNGPYFEEYVEELIVLYAEDTPRNIKYVTEESFADYGLNKETIRQRALENFARLFPHVEILGNQGFFMLRVDGNYEASCILDRALMERIAKMVSGELVMIVPSRDLVLLTGTKEEAGIERLRKGVARAFPDNGYRISSSLFVYAGGTWSRYIENAG